MSLVERVNEDLKEYMKAKDKDSLSVIRMLKSAIQMAKIELKHDLSDSEVIDVISKASRDDLASQYQKEIDILNRYMPEALSLEDVNKIIDEVIDRVKPESVKQMGLIIKEVSPKVKGRFDMGEVSKIVKDKLSNL